MLYKLEDNIREFDFVFPFSYLFIDKRRYLAVASYLDERV
jgi:hypothetical protein